MAKLNRTRFHHLSQGESGLLEKSDSLINNQALDSSSKGTNEHCMTKEDTEHSVKSYSQKIKKGPWTWKAAP